MLQAKSLETLYLQALEGRVMENPKNMLFNIIYIIRINIPTWIYLPGPSAGPAGSCTGRPGTSGNIGNSGRTGGLTTGG